MPLGPGADAALACFAIFSTSLHVGGLMSIWCSGARIGGISLGMVTASHPQSKFSSNDLPGLLWAF